MTIPYWMREVAEVGKQSRQLLSQASNQQKNEQAYTTQLPPLWGDKPVQREQMITMIRKANNMVGQQAQQVQALTQMSNMMRGIPFDITNISFGDNCIRICANLKDGVNADIAIPANFNFTVTPTCEVLAPSAFMVNETSYPANLPGVKEAFRTQKTVYSSAMKAITRAQISDRLKTTDPVVIDVYIDKMIKSAEITPIGNNVYSYKRLPKALELGLVTANAQQAANAAATQAEMTGIQQQEKALQEKKKALQMEKTQQATQANQPAAPTPPASPAMPGQTAQKVARVSVMSRFAEALNDIERQKKAEKARGIQEEVKKNIGKNISNTGVE